MPAFDGPTIELGPMHWILLSVASALLLGVYDAAKKWSVRDNAVPIVLLCSVSIGAGLYLPLVVWSHLASGTIPFDSFVVGSLSWRDHGLVAGKSVLVGASWTLAFSALKHLPLSIAAPIRASSPFWTIVVAVGFLGERPTAIQWTGMFVVLVGFWRFTLVGKMEGIRFARDRSVYLMVAATLLGACSSIYDKWLLQHAGFQPVTLQAWFTIYLVPVMVPLAGWWYRHDRPRRDATIDIETRTGKRGQPFHWRWSIAVVSPLLIVADWFYFVALSDPSAMVSVVSVVRRCSVVIALVFGAKALDESNFRAKAICVAVILVGVLMLTWTPV
ncbi:MAG: EamA family transporter [Planctomycetota bacterium]